MQVTPTQVDRYFGFSVCYLKWQLVCCLTGIQLGCASKMSDSNEKQLAVASAIQLAQLSFLSLNQAATDKGRVSYPAFGQWMLSTLANYIARGTIILKKKLVVQLTLSSAYLYQSAQPHSDSNVPTLLPEMPQLQTVWDMASLWAIRPYLYFATTLKCWHSIT